MITIPTTGLTFAQQNTVNFLWAAYNQGNLPDGYNDSGIRIVNKKPNSLENHIFIDPNICFINIDNIICGINSEELADSEDVPLMILN